MALSALYHTFSCRSECDYNTFLMYDLFGIALSLLAIYTSGVYYAFWCHSVSYVMFSARVLNKLRHKCRKNIFVRDRFTRRYLS